LPRDFNAYVKSNRAIELADEDIRNQEAADSETGFLEYVKTVLGSWRDLKMK